MTRAFATAVVALLTAASASAQSEYGSRINRTPGAVGSINRVDEETARRVMNIYGRCVARNRRPVALQVLALPLMSPEQTELVRDLFGGEDRCLGPGERQLQFQALLVVGPMAEEMILRDHASDDLDAIAGMTDARMAEVGLTPRTGYEDFAFCLVRRAPQAARTLVDTIPATPAESAAISAIRPHLGACLPQGENFSFNVTSLRAIVSAGLFLALSALGAEAAGPSVAGS